MLGDINYDIVKRKPKLYLAKPSFEIIAILSDAYNINCSAKFGGILTLEFDIPYERDVNHVLTRSNADSIKFRYLLQLKLGSNSYWFLINKYPQDNMTENSDYMHVEAMLLPIELMDKKIYNYTVDSNTPTQIITTLLSDTIWTIGTISDSLDEKYRTYEFNSTNVYDSILQVAEKVNGILQWDTENRTISLYEEDDLGVNRGLRLKYSKYLKAMNRNYSTQEMVTRLKPHGKDNLTISEVTPHAQNWVQDFSNFATSTYMSSGLITSIESYDALLETKEPTTDTATTGTTTTNISLPIHGLILNDWILNQSRSNEYRIVAGVPDVDNITVTSITGMTINDTILKYSTGTYRKMLFDKEVLDTELTTLSNELIVIDTELGQLEDTFAFIQQSAEKDEAEYGSSGSLLILSSHGMVATGGWIRNEDYEQYREVTIVDSDSVSLATAVTGQSMGNTIFKYPGDPTRSDINAKIVEQTNKRDEIDNKNAEIASIEIEITVDTGASADGDITFSIDGEDIVVTVASGDTTTSVATKIVSAFDGLYEWPDIDYIASGSSNVVTAYYLATSNDEADVTISFADTDTTNVTTTIVNTNYGISNQISEMVNEVSMTTNFTTAQLSELNPFIIEQEWLNEFFSDAQDLYEATQEELTKRNTPQPILDVDILNFLEIVEQQHNWDKLGFVNLGDTCYIEYDKLNVDVEAKIVQIDFDFENATVNLKIANIKDIKNEEDKTLSWFKDFINAKNELDIKKVSWNTGLENFNARNDRLSTTPANPTIAVDGTALQRNLNDDGSVDINFSWTFPTTSEDMYNIDGFTVFVRSALTPEEYTFGSSSANEQLYNINSNKRSFSLLGISATRHYTFGIQAYRIVDSDINSTGILKSSLIQPTLITEDPYQPASDLDHNSISKNSTTVIVADGSTSAARSIKSANYVVPIGSLSAQTTINTAIDSLPTLIFNLGTAQAGATSTITLATGASDSDDEYLSYTVEILGGAGSGESKTIIGYVGSSNIATVDSAWSVTPGATSTYRVTSPCGKVILMEGIYTIDDEIEVPSNITLEGQGNGTIIKLKDSAAALVDIIENSDTTNGNSNINLINFKIDGNKTNITGTHNGINIIKSVNCTIYNLNVVNNSGIGINLGTNSNNNTVNGSICQGNGNGISVYSYNNTISGNLCQNNSGGNGISVYSYNNTISGNTCQNNSAHGIYLYTNTYNNTITGNTCQGNGEHGISLSTNTNNNTVTGNTCQGNTEHGIYLYTESNNNTVNSNTCQKNGQSSNAVYHNIYIGTTSDYNNIQNNTCRIADIMRENTAQAGAASTITLDASASAVDDYYNNKRVRIISGTGSSQNRLISDYDGITKVATVSSNWGTNPDATSVFRIYDADTLPRYGIRIGSGCTGNLVANNDLYNSGAIADLSDGGTATITTSANRV